MPAFSYAPFDTFGIHLLDNTTPSGTNKNANTVIQNNIIHGFNTDSLVWTELSTPLLPAIDLNYNIYFSAAPSPFRRGFNTVVFSNFAGWKSAIAGADANSQFVNPQLVDVTKFRATGTNIYSPYNAGLMPGSAAIGTGTPQGFTPPVNFLGVTRSGWNIGAF